MTKNELTRCLRDTGQTELRRLVDVTRHKSATILLLRATQVDVCLQQLSLIKQRLLLSKAGVSPQPGHVFHPVLHRLAVGQRRPVQPGRTRGTRCWVSSHNTSTGSWMGFTLGCGSGFAGTTEVCFMISFKHGRPRMFQSRLHQPTLRAASSVWEEEDDSPLGLLQSLFLGLSVSIHVPRPNPL